MTELLTAAGMRDIEQAAISSGGVTALALMERAGQGAVEAIFVEWPQLGTGRHRAVVLCGPGNNGGDGFVVARVLKAAGWAVEVYLYGDVAGLPQDARVNAQRWQEADEIRPLDDGIFDVEKTDEGIAVWVDAVFGTGLTRPFLSHPRLCMALNAVATHRRNRRSGPIVVALDVPSGWCADSGKCLGVAQPFDTAILANMTVAFHAAKVGHYLGSAPAASGAIRIVDIGLVPVPDQRAVRLITPDVERLVTLHKQSGHKFSYGSVLVLSGGVGKGGAARLAGRGALRIGAGLVTLCPPPAALIENAMRLDAIMLRAVKDGDALAAMLEDARITALCLGPGLGTGAREAGLVRAALETGGVDRTAVVLDGDALTILAGDAELFGMLHPRCVLTPHAGEFARLFPDIAERLDAIPTTGPAFSKVDAAREAAARVGCVVLFKGPDTVIVDGAGRCSIHSAARDRAAPWLATAGSGDVLAGFVTGLLARGVAPMQAAETAAWLHVDCALTFGPGLVAKDLPEALPGVFRALGL